MFFVTTWPLVDSLVRNGIELFDTVLDPYSVDSSKYDSFLRVWVFEFIQ